MSIGSDVTPDWVDMVAVRRAISPGSEPVGRELHEAEKVAAARLILQRGGNAAEITAKVGVNHERAKRWAKEWRDGPSELPETQVAALRLIAEGLSYKDIAARLFMSEATMRRNLDMAYRLLGARNAAHAVHLAYQEGVLKVGEAA